MFYKMSNIKNWKKNEENECGVNLCFMGYVHKIIMFCDSNRYMYRVWLKYHKDIIR